jgi:D-alanyl-lipoteichoic acid acyltransferase DltB (MBOAT superfamily)
MLFPTIDFAVFFVVVFVGSWLLRPRQTAWRLWILAASIYFYGYWSWRLVPLLLGTVVVNWAFGMAVHASLGPDHTKTPRSRALVAAAVVVDLTVLGYFKYTDFFVGAVAGRLQSLGVHVSNPTLSIVLPIGISFFTFQAISYVVDIGRGVWTRPVPLLEFAVYLTFFAHLVAGPIVRASEFIPQLERAPDPRRVESGEAFVLILRGLFKKVVISSYMATVADPVFALPQLHSRWAVLWGIWAYAIQIYADFAGYTDIAIGLALLLGIRFPQNFNSPYRAESFQDFWRRWHMTLSRWLRDYLYIPLGGNRGSDAFVYRNLMLTMVIGGLWHGANWTFVVWGAIHGTALVTERVVKKWWAARGPMGLPTGLVRGLQWFVTFQVVCLAWVFFRAPSMSVAFSVLGRLFSTGGSSALVTPLLIATIVGMVAAQFVPVRWPARATEAFARSAPLVQAAALGVGLVLVDALGPAGLAPFIYFRF